MEMEESSINFQGNGESAVPAAPPIANDKKLRLSIFIESSPIYYLWHTKQPPLSV